MDTLRVSASDLDTFRYYRDDEEGELFDLLARLRRLSPPTESMMAGTALHKALENATEGTFNGFEVDGFTFSFETDAAIDLAPIREMKATGEYQIGDVMVTLVGKVDGIHGRRVDDHKFTARADLERFMDSYQWRVYLDIFAADEFRWNIFEARESAPRNYLIFAIHQLRMHAYPGMSHDIARELAGFVDFARQHLPEKFNVERAAA